MRHAALPAALLSCALSAVADRPLAAAPASDGRYSVRTYGAAGDGRTLDTDAVNHAILAASNAGGGIVVFPAGEYLCHSIRLRSQVTIEIGPGATIVAADPPREGEKGGYDAAEPNDSVAFQDFGHSHWHNSLIWGEGLEGVAIVGPGRIYGRGLSRGNGRVSLPVNVQVPAAPGAPPPDVLEADGPVVFAPRPDLVPGPFRYPNARDTLPDGVGNKAIALKNCRNVTLRGFSILHGGHFAILATGVDNLTIDNLTIDTNRDGMDIDGCRNVRITRSSVNSPWDDGICLKSSHALGEPRLTENVTISDCYVSGYDEGTLLDGTRQNRVERRGGPMGRIKLGTESGGGFRNVAISNCVFDHSRGLALEQVDGGVLEDIVVSNITMRHVPNAPIFLRLGARLRAPGAAQPGVVRRVTIDGLNAFDVARDHGIFIAGLPGHPVSDVVLSNIRIGYAGGGTRADAERALPEMEAAYPEPHLFGVLPSWGVYARHVTGLVLRGVEMATQTEDERPAVLLEDVNGAHLSDVALRLGAAAGAIPAGVRLSETDAAAARQGWSLRGVSGVRVRNVTGLPDGDLSSAR